jgi:hypothetical protein
MNTVTSTTAVLHTCGFLTVHATKSGIALALAFYIAAMIATAQG